MFEAKSNKHMRTYANRYTCPVTKMCPYLLLFAFVYTTEYYIFQSKNKIFVLLQLTLNIH